MSLAGCTQYYYLISCTLSPFLSCLSDILMLDWDICCGVLHSSLLVAWLCCCCYRCAGNYWRNPRCQSCHLWQPTHAAFRSLCTNQRTSAGQSRAIVELFSCSQLAQTSQDLMFLPARPHVPPLPPILFLLPFQSFVFVVKPSAGSEAWNKCLPSLPASVVNSEQCPPASALSPYPLGASTPCRWKPFRCFPLSLVPSVLGSGVNPSHSFLYAFVVLVFVRFPLFFLCCFCFFFWPDLSPFIHHCQSGVVFAATKTWKPRWNVVNTA